MSTIFLIHGSFGKPFENWLPWMETKLSEEKFRCFAPHFPTPEGQNYPNWCKLLDYYRDLNLINENTIFVGHSSGAIFTARYIADHRLRVKAYISVAGFNQFLSGDATFDNINKSFFTDQENLHRLVELAAKRYCFISDNDPYLPVDKLNEFASCIEAEKFVVAGGGHFNSAAGYDKFEQLLGLIKTV